jgi:hypothetical protein
VSDDRRSQRILEFSTAAVIAALYVVGIVSHGIIRHMVQTAPMWIGVWLAAKRSQWAKWAALPCLLLWLFLMINIWFFLLGWPHILSGTFSPVEIALTIIIAAGCVVGIGAGIRTRGTTSVGRAIALAVVVLALQLCTLRVSFIRSVSRDPWYHPTASR